MTTIKMPTFTRAEAVAHLKSLFKQYPDTFGKWEKVSDEGKEEDWDSYKDFLYRHGIITNRQYKTWGNLL